MKMDRQGSEWRKFKPVHTAKGDRVDNLYSMCGGFYSGFFIKGKLKKRKLLAQSLEEARREVAGHRREADLARLAGSVYAPAGLRNPGNALPTIEEMCAAYRAAAQRRSAPRAATVEMNVRYLERVAGSMRASVEVLTPDLLDAFAVEMQQGTEPDTPERDSRDRTIASIIRGARSVFAEREDFRKMVLPEQFDRFLKYNPVEPKLPPNLQPPMEVAVKTVEAGRKLKGEEAVAWCLCYDLGLRAHEVLGARWNWIEPDGRGLSFMVIRDRPEEGFRVKSSRCRVTRERRVPVPSAVLALLREHSRGQGSEVRSQKEELNAKAQSAAEGAEGKGLIFMPGYAETTRRNMISRKLCHWLRSVEGWWEINKGKGAHALRGLRGAFWVGKYGHVWTMAWMGHSDFRTTLDHYAKPLEYGEPLELDADVRARFQKAEG